jgi:Nucleotidyltransferase of unknown function (DUF6036)
MRTLVNTERLTRFMKAFGGAARESQSGRVYLAGGASAVLLAWRESTVDIDIKLSSSLEPLLKVVPELKERLEINVELASPGDFIPELPGWEDRSPFIERFGPVDFHHYDFYAQALAKIERGHDRDRMDVAAIHAQGLVEPTRLMELFARIEPQLYRYPALDPPSFRRAVEETVGSWS